MTIPSTTADRNAGPWAAGAQRTVLGLTGLLGLTVGVAALAVGVGLFGADRAGRPLLDPVVADILGAHPALARGSAIIGGVAMLAFGLLWLVRTVKPDRGPKLLLDPSPDCRLEVSASAVADALRADVETITGVNRALARMVTTTTAPIVRLDLWLEDGTDVRDVYRDLDTRVLTRARDSLGIASLPAAIRIELAAVPARRRIN